MIAYSFYKIGLMPEPEIDLYKTHKLILSELKNKETIFKTALSKIGITFNKFKIYVPKTYNFDVDTIDIIINNKILKSKLKNAILENKELINMALSKNKSYDGYLALTIDSVETELENMNKPKYQIDVLILNTLIEILIPNIREQILEIIHNNIIEYRENDINEYI